MNGVIYYTNTGQSKTVAQFFAEKTSFPLFNIYDLHEYSFDTAVLVFPVHCQHIPTVVKNLLRRLSVRALAVVATYGKMCFGNVLYEIRRHYRHNIIAGAYVPTKHSYLNEPSFDDFDRLMPIVDKLNDPTPVKLPKTHKNPLSGFCMRLRSRMGVKIYKDDSCDGCGVCESVCANSAIRCGKPNGRCIRCLKCVISCPKHALHFVNRLPMRLYLRKKKVDKLILYTV